MEGKVIREIEKNSLIQQGEKIGVAVSGGPDSICLLSLLKNFKEKYGLSLFVLHFNHRLRGIESDRDEEFVKKISAEWGIECLVGRSLGKNLYKNEEEAREARFSFFEKIFRQSRMDKIALAHNSNDLAETFLMRMLRGSGLEGLRGISPVRGNYIRPLLSITRPEIEGYLKTNALPFRIDKTNLDRKFLRNKIRLDLLPHLSQYNPNIIETLSNMSKHLAYDFDYIETEVDRVFKEIAIVEAGQISIPLKEWLSLPQSIRFHTLRKGLGLVGSIKDITFKQLNEATNMLETGIGAKIKSLPHSLQIELSGGKINLFKKDNTEIYK